MNRCEDFPCCGHTYDDPCGPQWYDAPDAFDTRVNPHALCEHEFGFCDVDRDDEEGECDLDYDLDLYEGHTWCWTHDQYGDLCESVDS